LGIIPNRESVFTRINFPTRIFEYLALNKPCIVPRFKGIRDYFDDSNMFYFESGDAESLAEQIVSISRDPKATLTRLAAAKKVYQDHCWSAERRVLTHDVYERVLSRSRAPGSEPSYAR
jgi:glycosyltransferase involved in cell wall biosynthesis